jgi:hypothetical protein
MLYVVRYAYITEEKLCYYDMGGAFKGEFDIEDCSVHRIDRDECKAPDQAFAFKISNFSLGGEFINCYVHSEQLRTLFATTLLCKVRALAQLRELLDVPPRCYGFMRKQGSRIKSWKRRFFVLSYGKLKYYEFNGLDQSGSGEKELGAVDLKVSILYDAILFCYAVLCCAVPC